VLVVDGSMGEGGGQILRSSLALSLLTGLSFRIANIRARRSKKGLMRQHLVCVQAAARVGDAETSGAEIGSTELVFRPKAPTAGDYTFAIGSAGSTTLVFQTVLFPLLLGTTSPSTLRFEGGTHNPMAPPVDFLEHAFLPVLARMGGAVDIAFERHGFYPAGGGAWSATIHPPTDLAGRLRRLELSERGAIVARRADALVAQISPSVATRELSTLASALGWPETACRPVVVQGSRGPGNALVAVVESEHVTELVTGFGERGVRAEIVAGQVAEQVARYLRAGVPVGEHLADQLLLPMALGGGGTFKTLRPSEHTTTQMALLQEFLGVTVRATAEAEDVWRIDVPESAGHGTIAR
jgi:RNA 3'-terminal phosphate cyclase (ATP)